VVRKAKKLSRTAFTLIELIFAIVIISIAVASLPMMILVNNKSMEDSMVQEAIFAASAELMNASVGYWDANSMADYNVSNLSRVIDIGSTCENNTSSPRYRLRPGHIAQAFHRRCLDDSISITAANESNNIYPNLNNAEHTKSDMFLSLDLNASGYKDKYKSSLSIVQVNDVKHIQIEVSNSKEEVITILKMQSANIGEIDYYKRKL